MQFLKSCLFPAALAIAATFSGCDRREAGTASPDEEAPATGRVAFRLGDTVLQVVRATSDSVRIEAVRDGYPARFATGPVGGSVLLTDLAPGPWTVKVAAFDTSLSVSWYGETPVQVVGGTTVPAVLVLRRATGSVDLRIVLDTLPSVIDTMVVAWVEGDPSRYKKIPIEAAWRTDRGIFIATRYAALAPVVVHNPAQSSLPRCLYLGALAVPGVDSLVPVRSHVILVPFPRTEAVDIADIGRDTVFRLPGEPVVQDTSRADTIEVRYALGNVSDYRGIPVEGAWRGDSGIYILTKYDYFMPEVIATPTQTRVPSEITLVGKPIVTVVAVKLLPHVVFVPFPAAMPVAIANLLNDSIIRLPGKTVVQDSSFLEYTRAIRSGWTGLSDVIVVSSTGSVVRQVRQPLVDTTVSIRRAVLPPDTLAAIRRILEQASTRHPDQVPAITGDCPTDMPTTTRSTRYVDGSTSAMSWNPSSYCGEMPASWMALDPVDAILDRLFASLP